MTLKLGYKASAEQFAPRELVELAVAAEAHGMDSATVSDHFQPWRHEGGHAPFSLAWMTAVGERTKHLILGTSVLTPTFRYNPAVIAQSFATMGCLYPDRIFLGVVEKDYVLGWLLAGIAKHPVTTHWAFKGGTCLRKCWFETYRFSEDLDFTVPAEDLEISRLAEVSGEIAEWATRANRPSRQY
jgi:Luciferase-like monooxygenase/Nucleotidyl transferase AbiEii toxin, Type IV TA system